MKNVLIYDFDGVIIDSVMAKGRAFCTLFEKYDLKIVNKINRYHNANGGMPRDEKIKNIFKYILNENPSDGKIDAYCIKFSEIVLEMVMNCNFINGSFDFISKENKNYKQYIVSATPQKELNYIVKEKMINNYFLGIYGSPITKDIHINNIVNSHVYNVQDVIYIGDSLSDYDYATKAGVKFIGFKSDLVTFPKEIEQIDNLYNLQKELKIQ